MEWQMREAGKQGREKKGYVLLVADLHKVDDSETVGDARSRVGHHASV